ncbi:MAG: aldehyde ferredoxin oxidoreductase family protein [Chloroflexi bacterium]|nr:aldehyde ferredoxin oxidoreductase family protein [Chloroflexota bacterium]
MPNGYNGKILHVDLTHEKLTIEEPPESFYRRYLGGSAMGMHYLLKEMQPGADPLGPGNVLTLMLSVLTGAPISGQSRMTASARSPLVDGVGDSQCGGFWPAELKFAGFDGIVVKGRAGRPVYLWIKDGQAELRDASHLWGKITGEAEALLKAELGDDKVEILQIGPGGERLVRTAAIMNMSNRANGRTGMGAVMGSKNLKAIAVRGSSKRLPLAHPRKLNALARQGAAELDGNADMKGLQDMGTASVLSFQHASGTLPTRNYDEGQFENFDPISGEVMTETILVENDTCYACTVRCKRVVETEFINNPVLKHYGGPEYETLSTFGSYCGVDNLDAVALANQLCNQYGLDTIGTGATIAWAIDCFVNGALTAQDTGGLELRYGDAETMVRLTEMIANREGFGDVLAEGSRRAADRLGKGHDYLITVKGAEAPAHMPQAKRSLGLIYAVNAFGADHQSSEHDPMVEEGGGDLYFNRLQMLGLKTGLAARSLDDDKITFAHKTHQFYSFLDSADLCQFVYGPAWTLYGPQEAIDTVRAITGWEDFGLEDILAVGELRLNMMRQFNAREGLTRADDKLPAKFFKALKGAGPTAGVRLDMEEIEYAKEKYYELAGWDKETGNPTPETLARLGLEWTVA